MSMAPDVRQQVAQLLEMIPRNDHEIKHREKRYEPMNKEMESHLNPKIMTWE